MKGCGFTLGLFVLPQSLGECSCEALAICLIELTGINNQAASRVGYDVGDQVSASCFQRNVTTQAAEDRNVIRGRFSIRRETKPPPVPNRVENYNLNMRVHQTLCELSGSISLTRAPARNER